MTLAALEVGRTALLVIDMQNAFCHPEGTLEVSGEDVDPARETIPRIARLVQAARQSEIPVIWTVQEHLPRDRVRARKRLPDHTQTRQRASSLAGSWDARLVEELASLAKDPTFVITRHRVEAFYQTRLDQLLRKLGTQALLVTGVIPRACVETTLLEAYLRDYDLVAVTDCIATVSPQSYPVAREVWEQYLDVLATSEEVAAWLEEQARPRTVALHHLLLQVSDIGEAERFYCGVLGFTLKSREPFRDGRPFFNTYQGLGVTVGGSGDGVQVGHVAFRVLGVQELAERVREEGHEIIRGPGPGPYGLTVYVADPDGNEVELIEEEEER